MDSLNPKIIVIAGANGAGKSTLAPHLIKDRLGLIDYINADMIANGLLGFHPEKGAIEAGRIMLKHLQTLAKQRICFAFETTLASRSFAPWIEKLIRQNYEFHIFFIWLQDVEIAIQRVKERVRLGGHNIPEQDIRRRYVRGVYDFFTLYKSLAGTWSVYDNTVSKPVLLAKRTIDGIEIIYQSDLWQKFQGVSK